MDLCSSIDGIFDHVATYMYFSKGKSYRLLSWVIHKDKYFTVLRIIYLLPKTIHESAKYCVIQESIAQ